MRIINVIKLIILSLIISFLACIFNVFSDEIPKENIKLFEDIALCLNANIVWIDVLSKDLTKVLWKNDYSLIEVNVSPWIRMHHFPSKWKQRNIAKYILIELFPNAF